MDTKRVRWMVAFWVVIVLPSWGYAQQSYTWKENGITRHVYVKPYIFSKSISAQSVSPTFSDHPNGSGVERTLPGGVIVTFDSPRTETDVMTTAQTIGANSVTRMPYGHGKVWLIHTSGGTNVFGHCDQLSTQEGVQEAKPNWGIKFAPK